MPAHFFWTRARKNILASMYAKKPMAEMRRALCVSANAIYSQALMMGLSRGRRTRGEVGEILKRWKDRGYWAVSVCGVGPMREHRYLMEKHLGRKLKRVEVVHHVNGVKHDNRLKNLMLFKNESDHWKWHREHPEAGAFNSRRKSRVIHDGLLTCAECGKDKLLECYHKDKSKPTGYANYCKPCNLSRQKAAYLRRQISK